MNIIPVTENNAQKAQTDSRLQRWVEWSGLALCILGTVLSVGMVFQDRTLWPDEAMLVWNLKTRTLENLTASPLDMCQTAPLLYLYGLKCSSLLLGTAEWAYRLPSVLAYAFLPFAVWWTAHRLFRLSYPWLCAGFCANLKVLLWYSNQVKPYMGEALWVLAALMAHHAFVTKRLSWWGLAVAWSLLGLSGNPVWFAVAGCLAFEVPVGMARKDGGWVLRCFGAGGLFAICMAVYWVLWLAPVAHSSGMQDYWDGQMLPWPLSPTAIRDCGRLFWHLFVLQTFGVRGWYLLPLLAGSLVPVVKEHHRWGAIAWLTFACALGASCLRLFPISMRLWIFSVPLWALLAFWTMEKLAGPKLLPWAGMLLAAMAVANLGVIRWNPTNNYCWGRELNDSIAYVEKHLRNGESVYVPGEAFARVQCKNGVWNNRMGNSSQDNVIWGGFLQTDGAMEADLARVEATESCWLLMANRIEPVFLERLAANGMVEMVHEFQGTLVARYHHDSTMATEQAD